MTARKTAELSALREFAVRLLHRLDWWAECLDGEFGGNEDRETTREYWREFADITRNEDQPVDPSGVTGVTDD